MTNPDYAHTTLVVDRSGSMGSTAVEANGAIAKFLKEQFELPGKFTCTLVQFDTEIETVQSMQASAFDYALLPRGGTALLDAVGKAMAETGETLAALHEDERPDKVILMVVTDGMENASREWTVEKVRDKIAHQRDAYAWEFIFIGADDSAWQGGSVGIKATSYDSTRAGATMDSYTVASASIGAYRSGTTSNVDMPTTV